MVPAASPTGEDDAPPGTMVSTVHSAPGGADHAHGAACEGRGGLQAQHRHQRRDEACAAGGALPGARDEETVSGPKPCESGTNFQL